MCALCKRQTIWACKPRSALPGVVWKGRVATSVPQVKEAQLNWINLGVRHFEAPFYVYSTKVKSRQTSPAPLPKRKAEFIEPMECALVPKLPEGSDWTFEAKLDGYRAIGVKGNNTILYSRNHKNFNKRFPQIADALNDLPFDTVIDGEVAAPDESGRPDFHRLQHFAAEASRIHYFVFDLLIVKGRDLTSLPLTERRKLLKSIKLPSGWIRISEQFDISADQMLAAGREQGLETVVEFLEWTEGDRLRHSKFVALRDDKNPREVVKEA